MIRQFFMFCWFMRSELFVVVIIIRMSLGLWLWCFWRGGCTSSFAWISNCFKESLAFARIRMARWSWISILLASSPHARYLVVWKRGTSHLFTLIHPVSNSDLLMAFVDLGWLGWGKTGLSHLLVLLVAKLWQQLPLNVKLRFPL